MSTGIFEAAESLGKFKKLRLHLGDGDLKGKLTHVLNGERVELNDSEMIEVKAEAEKIAAQGTWLIDRQIAYAKLNQHEMHFDDMMNGTTNWKDAILAIKAKYPKPSE